MPAAGLALFHEALSELLELATVRCIKDLGQ
jgi:hypothetical protein